MPKRTDHQTHPRHRLRSDRDRPGLRVRLLGHAGVQGAASRRARGRPRQQQPGDDHDRPGDRGPHVRRAADRRRCSSRSSSASVRTRCCRPSAARRRSISPSSSARTGMLEKSRRRADRRVGRRDQGRRGPPASSATRCARSASTCPTAATCRSMEEAMTAVEQHRLSRSSSGRRSRSAASAAASPTTSRSSGRSAGRGLDMSPVHEILVEESVIGWKEFELEVMRDCADNFVVICSIENIDPMGVHTGDSITVAPALTLTDKEYQRMRDAARRIIRPRRRRDRRLEHPVRDQSGERPDGRHRDEPARVALVGAGVEGHRASRSRRSPPSSRSATRSTRSRTTSRA